MNRPWTPSELTRLRHLRAAHSLAHCARALSRSKGSISGALTRLHLTNPRGPTRRYRAPTGLRKAIGKVLRRCGVTEAADVLGVSRQCIYATLRAMGTTARALRSHP